MARLKQIEEEELNKNMFSMLLMILSKRRKIELRSGIKDDDGGSSLMVESEECCIKACIRSLLVLNII